MKKSVISAGSLQLPVYSEYWLGAGLHILEDCHDPLSYSPTTKVFFLLYHATKYFMIGCSISVILKALSLGVTWFLTLLVLSYESSTTYSYTLINFIQFLYVCGEHI